MEQTCFGDMTKIDKEIYSRNIRAISENGDDPELKLVLFHQKTIKDPAVLAKLLLI
jgi:hypothetical protein